MLSKKLQMKLKVVASTKNVDKFLWKFYHIKIKPRQLQFFLIDNRAEIKIRGKTHKIKTIEFYENKISHICQAMVAVNVRSTTLWIWSHVQSWSAKEERLRNSSNFNSMMSQ